MEDTKVKTHETEVWRGSVIRLGVTSPWTGTTSWTMISSPTYVKAHDNVTIVTGNHLASYAVRRRNANGQLVIGPLSAVWNRADTTSGEMRYAIREDATGWCYHYTNSYGAAPTYVGDHIITHDSTALVSHVTNDAAALFLSKYLANRKLLSAAVAGEARKTAQLVVEKTNDVAGAFRSACDRTEKRIVRLHGKTQRIRPKMRRKFALAGLLDIASENYVRLNFAVRPLLSDLENLTRVGVNLGDTTLYDRPLDVRARVKGHEAFSGDMLWVADPTTGLTIRTQRLVKRLVQVKLKTRMFIEAPGFSNLGALGWEPRDLIPSIYELIPWSWLLDYVTNAGQVIEAYSQFTGVGGQTQRTVSVVEHDTVVQSDATAVPSGYSILYKDVRPGTRKAERGSISRTGPHGIQFPTFEIRNNLNPFRVSMLASVGWMLTKRLRIEKQVNSLLSFVGYSPTLRGARSTTYSR